MVRTATVERSTRETAITVTVALDGTGRGDIQTPIPFLTHMVDQIARHGGFDLTVRAAGDVEIDGHHTTEDLAIVLGRAVDEALGDRVGIRRYGEATLPMDEEMAPVDAEVPLQVDMTMDQMLAPPVVGIEGEVEMQDLAALHPNGEAFTQRCYILKSQIGRAHV